MSVSESKSDDVSLVAKKQGVIRRSYSKEEDVKILNFIIKNKRFSDIRGNELWKVIEARHLLEDRSWQSMKERFRKIILPKISQYDLDPAIASKFNKVEKKEKHKRRFRGKF